MQTYSHEYNGDVNEDAFDDDPDRTQEHLNSSSSDLKFRRTNKDASNHPILHRALSTVSANQSLVHNQRNLLAKNFRRISVNDDIVTIDHNDADASFLLPNLYELPDEIRIRVMDSLVDTPTMSTLEETRRLNWWVNKKLPCPKLYPLLTSGDGNCLLHATSLAMWGFHDHSLSMRKALNETMITSKPNNSLYRRWRWAQSVQNKKYGLVFSEQEWNEEWKSLLRLSSAEPRISQTNATINPSDSNQSNNETNRYKSSQTITSINTGGSTKSTSQSTRQYYESLEEFHVYVLANNIRRPIIVYSDTVLRTNDGEAISPIEFGGIYLPLEIPPEKCHKQPLFLAFDAAHFSALVPMEQNSKPAAKATYRIPLIDIDTTDLLPIHFFIDPGPSFSWPIDEELSDDKIHLYTHHGESRIDVLEAYLNLSKESCPLNQLNPQAASNPLQDDLPSTGESTATSPINADISVSTVEANSTTTPTIPKKPTRTSFVSFSRIIRRTFIEPFSSVKRSSMKQQRAQQSTNADASESSMMYENESKRRASSPLLNARTNVLTIIVTNFQPKRPKASDNMIKNYVDACMEDYRLEKNKQKLNDASANENEDVPPTEALPSQQGTANAFTRVEDTGPYQKSATNNRYYSSTSTQRYQSELDFVSNDKRSERRVPPVIGNAKSRANATTRPTQRNYDIDDNDDSSMMDNGQLSSNITYVQKSHSKLTPLSQSNSFEVAHGRHHYPESYVNGLVQNRTKTNESSTHRLSTKGLPSTFQPAPFKRQQSLAHDKNLVVQRVPDSHRRS